MAEGRFQRWSRLKRKGGADARDEARLEEARDRQGSAAPTMEELPGGKLSRTVAPPLPSLAAEEADDPKADVVLPPTPPGAVEVDALAGQAATEDFFAGLEEGELTEEEQAVVADLPPLDSLTKDSDFTPFLQPGVPDIIKHKALRLLWRKDPFFNIRDGLNDYDEDYNLVATALGAVQSAWQAGSGYAERAEETLEKVEETLGSSEGPQSESRQQAEALQDESQAASESERASQDREALGESDAAGDSSADALRRVADPAADPSPDVPPEQSDK